MNISPIRRYCASLRNLACREFIALIMLVSASARGDTIVLRSGNGPIGGQDANIRRIVGTATTPIRFSAFTSQDFIDACAGPPASIVPAADNWLPGTGGVLTSDPQALWIAKSLAKPASSALYCYSFNVPCQYVASATMTIAFAVDDTLGDPYPGGANEVGLYINQTPINSVSGGSFDVPKTIGPFSIPLVGGPNTLHIYDRDLFIVLSGLIFTATIDYQCGGACSDCGPGPHWIHNPSCPAGDDFLPSTAIIGLDSNLDCIQDTPLALQGPVRVRRSEPRDTSMNFPGTGTIDGHPDVIDTEMLSMVLSGGGVTVRAGAGLGASPLPATLGAIVEQTADPALARSFFDVMFEVDLGGGTYAYNQSPLRVETTLTCVPPATIYAHPTGCLPLYSSPVPGSGVHVANITTANHSVGLKTGACCTMGTTCQVTTATNCTAIGGAYRSDFTACLGDLNGNGKDDACDCPAGGNLFLSCDDADDSGHCQGTACGALYPKVLTRLYTLSNSTGSGILTIGINGGTAQTGFNSWNNTVNGGPGVPVTNLTTAASIAAVDFRNFRMVYIPSDENDTIGGISPAQLDALNARQQDIQDFVNVTGGSLLALTEIGLSNAWGWLPVQLTTTAETTDNVFPTTEMATIDPNATAANMSHKSYHCLFTGPSGYSGLVVLARRDDTTELPVILGGVCRTLSGEVCDNSVDDDGDGLIDCNDPDCKDVPNCAGAVCGNGMVEPGEECDNDIGNPPLSHDGCNSMCRLEGACCHLVNGTCVDNQTQQTECSGPGFEFRGRGTACPVFPACAHCGNNILEVPEQCDGTADAACPGGCRSDCTCAPPFCGNGFLEPGEQCDGSDDAACPGLCLPNCHCSSDAYCGNGIRESGEQCDGPDDAACPGACLASCVCGVAGACCDNQGICSAAAGPGSCGGVFQGYGTTCDVDNGYDPAFQSCCPQPIATGGDNCSDAVIHNIYVPAPGSDPVTVTITGNNSGATSTAQNPDSCSLFAPSNDSSSDVGWWEGFSINACAHVRVDTCCTGNGQSTIHPLWNMIFPDCPCGVSIAASPNPNSPLFNGNPEPASGQGAPYCNDSNSWVWFGPLNAGTYYYPVYSALAGYRGIYQMHITVMPCPIAACCANRCASGTNPGTACTSNAECAGGGLCESACLALNAPDCAAFSGYYLGPPNKYPAVSTCVSTTCSSGACCTGPGQCVDKDLDPPISAQECITELHGKYVGGMRCHGGTCFNDPFQTCSTDADCHPPTAGLCSTDSSPQQAAAPSPCPICEFQSASNCQGWENAGKFGISDRSNGANGLWAADDFKSNATTISQVCVWGIYLNGSASAQPLDCGASVTQDNFRVRIYNDFEGLPCDVFQESLATSVRVVQPGALSKTLFGAGNPVETYGFELTLNTPITGLDATGNTIYWLEVSNDPVNPTLPECFWNWDQLKADTFVGNHYSASGTNSGYPSGSQRAADFSWCLSGDVVAGASGNVLRSCCNCSLGTCRQTTLNDCLNALGVWDVDSQACAPCTQGGPPNDNCTSTIGHLVGVGSYNFNLQCANSDGPSATHCTDGGATASVGPDAWFRFQAPVNCRLIASMCGTGTAYDSMVAVYHNPTNSCTFCPTDANSGNNFIDGCFEDESCNGHIGIGGSGVHTMNAVAGECYLIRVGGYNGATGSGTVDISCTPMSESVVVEPLPSEENNARGTRNCGAGQNPLPPVADLEGKVRYISFTIPAPASPAETALQVTLASLMHPNPPNLPQFPPPNFSSFEGQFRWVGATRFAECVGGTNAGHPCVAAADCPSGSCVGTRCAGGANVGQVCTSGTGCPGSSCAQSACVESETPATFFMCAPLQCMPHYENYSAHTGLNPLHVYGPDIVPSSSYMVAQLAVSCQGNEGTCTSHSTGVMIKTRRWGDVFPTYQLPSPAPLTQPNISDVSAIVDKFKSVSGAIIRARGDLVPNTPDNTVNISDVAGCVDAFKNLAYVQPGPQTCP